MDKPRRKQLDSIIDLHNRDLLHDSLLIGGICDLLTTESFDEIMDTLPLSAQDRMARWIRRIPRDPQIETLDPLPEDICQRLFAWLDGYETSQSQRRAESAPEVT